MILLANIVHRGRQTSHADAAQLEQHAKRQVCRPGDDGGVRRFGMCHPDRYRQWSAIRATHDIVGFIMSLIEPDDGQSLCTQRMKSVVDRDFRGAMLMGSMWMSCLRR